GAAEVHHVGAGNLAISDRQSAAAESENREEAEGRRDPAAQALLPCPSMRDGRNTSSTRMATAPSAAGRRLPVSKYPVQPTSPAPSSAAQNVIAAARTSLDAQYSSGGCFIGRAGVL